MPLPLPEYAYGGARALVALHARHLEIFWQTWQRADASSVQMPESEDPNYASRDTLLVHVLGCAARYLTWVCDQLELERPVIEEFPTVEGFAARADQYLHEVLAAWELPLRSITVEQADGPTFVSRWGVSYSIDAMLEHAVVHPIRHTYQLENLMES